MSSISFSPSRSREHLLALDLRKLAKIAVPPEKVEGVKHQPVLTARGEFGLQFRKIGPSFVDDHHFAVDDRLTGNIEGAGNHGKPLGPVQPVAGVDLLLSAG